MKTIEEVYQESLARIEKAEPITEIAKEIKRVTDALGKNELSGWSADLLSRAFTKIAILRVNLGAEMANAVTYYDISYLNRKIRYAAEWKPTKDKLSRTLKRATIQDIDSAIQEKLADLQMDELKNKHYAEALKILYDSTETLITTLQSRLSVLKQERKEARYG